MKKQKDEEIKKKENQAENECQCEGTDKNPIVIVTKRRKRSLAENSLNARN